MAFSYLYLLLKNLKNIGIKCISLITYWWTFFQHIFNYCRCVQWVIKVCESNKNVLGRHLYEFSNTCHTSIIWISDSDPTNFEDNRKIFLWDSCLNFQHVSYTCHLSVRHWCVSDIATRLITVLGSLKGSKDPIFIDKHPQKILICSIISLNGLPS